jgi:hypothetical protein
VTATKKSVWQDCAFQVSGTRYGFGRALPKLYEKVPDLKVDLMLEERVLTCRCAKADVAIRMKRTISRQSQS